MAVAVDIYITMKAIDVYIYKMCVYIYCQDGNRCHTVDGPSCESETTKRTFTQMEISGKPKIAFSALCIIFLLLS